MIEADKKTENEWAFKNKASGMLDSIQVTIPQNIIQF